MSDHEVSHSIPRLHHERPFLFSWNRRLRHLHGISLRNIDTTPKKNRSRGKTITDDDAPYNLKSPTKRLRNEVQGLSQSRSYTDLLAIGKERPVTPQKTSTTYQKDGMPSGRPSIGKRRRSTLHWSTGSPRARQQKLEEVAAPRLADTWFSLHSKDKQLQEPVYISEIMEKSMNPSFAFFDLETSSPAVSRADECVLKVWAKDSRSEDYCLLLELDLNMRSLQYIGKNLESFHHPLPQNCILFHLSDGIYTSFTDLPGNTYGFSDTFKDSKDSTAPMESTSSFDALMQLANLDDCVQDALRARVRLEKEINSVLTQMQQRNIGRGEADATREQISTVRSTSSSVHKQTTALRRRRDDVKRSLKQSRDAIADSADSKSQLEIQLNASREKLKLVSENNLRVIESSTSQLRRIGEALLRVFPLEPIRNKTLQFTIRDLYLPNSVFDDTNRDEIAAALGFTSQLVHQLSLYMETPLPYQFEHNASYSFIHDEISVGLTQRKFPLHPTNVVYKFEYGVFLLNKNVEFLMNRAGLRVLDIRHTLPNLKYLLYVLTAGTGELPARKAGGIRGLFGGRLTPSISRRGSEDSVQSQVDYSTRASLDSRRNGSTVSSQTAREKSVTVEDPFWSSPRITSLPYRQSTLRDSVG